jgi:lipopolysaccharide export system protein LptA
LAARRRGAASLASLLRYAALPSALACAGPALEPLPATATATGVTVSGEAATGPYTVQLAGASGDVLGGRVDATTTTVQKAEAGGVPLQIQASRSSWDLKARSAHFEGEVVVTRGEVTMRCAALDVRYAGADTIDTVVATGGVHVDRGERHAEAERAELVGKNGKITLTGHPRLAEGVNALVGERIVLWLDDEKADCEGGASGPCALTVEGRALGK